MREKKKGLLIVISGPAGVGKGTICKKYFKKYDDMIFSVSTTTRKPRPGETDGVEYNFTTVENFKKLIQEDKLIEYVNVFDNFYGTSKEWVEEKIDSGKDVILEIEIVGASNIKKKYKDAVLIFVLPPTIGELEKRIRTRNTEEEDEIRGRLSRVVEEIKSMDKYNYFLINEDLDDSVEQLRHIILAERNSVQRYGQDRIKQYLKMVKEM